MEDVEHVRRIVSIDQTSIGWNSRSNPATYVGFYDTMRALFTEAPLSREREYKPGRFSFNVKGERCEECQGEGTIRTQLYFMPDVEVTCAACTGARFNSETLEVTLRGKTIDDILNMSVEADVTFAGVPPIVYGEVPEGSSEIDEWRGRFSLNAKQTDTCFLTSAGPHHVEVRVPDAQAGEPTCCCGRLTLEPR